MYIAFVLSMPKCGSWNGKWTGSDRYYAIVKNFRGKSTGRAKEILAEESFYYDFGDGWGANVSAHEVDSKEASQIKRNSKGFCNYGWMVNSIIDHLEIKLRG